jgi:hypothetical protein
MQFDHKHYVPILKGKRAEFPSLGSLGSKDRITPLMEAIPSKPVTQIPQGMASQWPTDQPYFIDFLFFDDVDEDTAPESHPLTVCFADVARRNQVAVPATGLARSPSYQAAVRSIAALHKTGVLIRLTPDDFEDVGELESALDAIPGLFSIDRNSIDLLIDLGSLVNVTAGTVAQIHRANIDLIPSLDEWRTLTVASSAFPLGLSSLVRDQWNPSPRIDWHGWRQIVTAPKRPNRLPSFGDYAIAHPDLPPEGQATILAQLRYATEDTWLIWKGRNAIQHGYDQFFAICSDLVQRPEYRGRDFSWGDAEIAQKATSVGSSGNAETWRRIGTNHHVETVLDQLSNLP